MSERGTSELALPVHDEDADKHDRGVVLVIGGTVSTPGALVLAGLAALRAGAGKLQLATDPAVVPALGVAVPEARVLSWHDEGLADCVERADAVLVGPGTWEGDVDDALAIVVERATGTIVVDAGALPALGRRGSLRMPAIATPNASEMEALGEDVASAAARLGCVVACREATTTVAAPDGRTWFVEDGCLGLATSGSGDVAAGIIAGLAARGAAPEAAAVWGARLHGRAGEVLATRVGSIGFLARELLDEIPGLLP